MRVTLVLLVALCVVAVAAVDDVKMPFSASVPLPAIPNVQSMPQKNAAPAAIPAGVDPATLPYDQRPPIMPALDNEYILTFPSNTPVPARRRWISQQPHPVAPGTVEEAPFHVSSLRADDLKTLESLPKLHSQSPQFAVQSLVEATGFEYLRSAGSGDATVHVVRPGKGANMNLLRARAAVLTPNVRLGDGPK